MSCAPCRVVVDSAVTPTFISIGFVMSIIASKSSACVTPAS